MVCSSAANYLVLNDHCAPSSNIMFTEVLMFSVLIVAIAIFSKQVANVWGLWVDSSTMCALTCGESCVVVCILMLLLVVEGSPLCRLVWCLCWHCLQWYLEILYTGLLCDGHKLFKHKSEHKLFYFTISTDFWWPVIIVHVEDKPYPLAKAHIIIYVGEIFLSVCYLLLEGTFYVECGCHWYKLR